MYANLNTTAKLTVSVIGKSDGKYLYQIFDKTTGALLSKRRSNREYVAATIDGNSFFGRVDLAQKCKPYYFPLKGETKMPVIAYLEDQPPFKIQQ